MNTPSSRHGHTPPAITPPKHAWHRRAAVALAALAAVGVAHAETKPTTRYAINLTGDSGSEIPLSNEPYSWTTHDGKVLSQGVTDDKGHAAVARQAGETHYVLETVNTRWIYTVDNACWSRGDAAFARCAKLTDAVNLVAQRMADNARDEQAAAARRRDAALARYRAAEAANDDELAWLGPLPAEWSRDDVQKQLDDVYGRIKQELDNLGDADIDVSRFVCRSPAQIGPAPDQQAVIDYMGSLREPGSTTPAQWTALVDAARKGNWLARLQIFVALGSRPKDDLVSVYRRIQLMAWLQANHVGALYTYYLGELAATGYFEGPGPGATSPVPLYAAMRGSYAAMKRAGDSLMARDEPDAQAIGRRMHDCALQMMPVLFAK
ncbi:hypothetical protein WT01_17620 [Burkholderia cepacia]|uniref:hypothetical protein n=1 Tax=Burkholderia cepacia TaxID=292 RepID=UPI00075860BF|nr:hypothetical protein [Burkholderia cepacia]KVL58152.1 hypothetical protein WT01_17620 [Burkholderia cepacia]